MSTEHRFLNMAFSTCQDFFDDNFWTDLDPKLCLFAVLSINVVTVARRHSVADRLISCCILQDLCWNALDNVVARKCLDRLIVNEVLKYRGE